MKLLIFAAFVLSLAFAEKYAIVIQGDTGYRNYSDSSNSCQGYDDLILSGMNPDNVIYMANEETLTHEYNPFPNKLFTIMAYAQKGYDHAFMCKDHFDYYSPDIRPEVVKAILRQDKERVKELTGYENPKVFSTTEEDTLFIYYTDHGYEGGIGCGDDVITREEILEILEELHAKKAYKKMLFYLEACESGSVFEGLDPKLNIYAMTSADSTSPAWCDYCPPDEDWILWDQIGTCMSMFFDNAFQKFWEQYSTTASIGEIFRKTRDIVEWQKPEQHPQEFGNMDMKTDPMTDFIGDQKIVKPPQVALRTKRTDSSIKKGDVERHVSKWMSIRAPSNKKEKELRNYEQVIANDAKREVETMRLGAQLLGEMEAYKAFGDNSRVVASSECTRQLSTAIVKKCGMTIPLLDGTKNVIHTICAKGVNVEEIDWASICM